MFKDAIARLSIVSFISIGLPKDIQVLITRLLQYIAIAPRSLVPQRSEVVYWN